MWDVARANALALEDSRTDFQAFNVGGGKALTVLEYARLWGGALGVAGVAGAAGAFPVWRHASHHLGHLATEGAGLGAASIRWRRRRRRTPRGPSSSPGSAITQMRGSPTMTQQGVVR